MSKDKKKVEQEEEEIDIITIHDDEGITTKFELLDTIELNGVKYMVMAPLSEDEEIEEEVEQVYITAITPTDDGKEMLEMIEDENLVDKIFEEFKKRNKNKFEFT